MSRKGYKQTEEHKRKIGKANSIIYIKNPELREVARKRNSGDNNPMYGKKHTQEWKDNHRFFMLENSPMRGKHHTEEARMKMGKKVKEAHKVKQFGFKKGHQPTNGFKKGDNLGNHFSKGMIKGSYNHTEEWKQMMREKMLGRIISPEVRKKAREWNIAHPNRKFKDTGIELKIEQELVNRGINFKKQVPLCKISRVDFHLSEQKIVVYADGCYYHGCPTHHPEWVKSKERDANQNKILTENGYKVYRFWECEINKNIEECINKIKL